MSDKTRYTITIGTKSVTLKQKGSGALRVANILGRSPLPGGRERIWLDRLIHEGGALSLDDGISLSGAVSTIVTRRC